MSDIGWSADLPDGVALKVPVGDDEVVVLAAALERLAREPRLREEMGVAARALAEGEHALERVAEAYTAALEEAAGGEEVGEPFGRRSPPRLRRPPQPDGAALGEVAEPLWDVGRGR